MPFWQNISHNIHERKHVLMETYISFLNRLPDYNIIVCFLICDDNSIEQWQKYTIQYASMLAFSLAFPSSIWHCTWLYKILILVFLSFFIVDFPQLCRIKPVQYEADILPYQLACDNWSRMKSAFASNAKHKQEGYVSSKMDKIVYSGMQQCYVPEDRYWKDDK